MDMKKIIAEVERVTDDARKDSNRIYPLFRNLHEAHNVIKEEIEEADDNRRYAHYILKEIWECTKNDCLVEAGEHANSMSKALSLQIAELMQAKAMCDKLVESLPEIEKFYEQAKKKELEND